MILIYLTRGGHKREGGPEPLILYPNVNGKRVILLKPYISFIYKLHMYTESDLLTHLSTRGGVTLIFCDESRTTLSIRNVQMLLYCAAAEHLYVNICSHLMSFQLSLTRSVSHVFDFHRMLANLENNASAENFIKYRILLC